MQHNGNDYTEIWKTEFPDGIKSDCFKEVSSDGFIFLQKSDNCISAENKNNKTVCYVDYEDSLIERRELHIQGSLIDSASEELFYAHSTWGEKDNKIIVHKTAMASYGGFIAAVLQELKLGQHRTLKPQSPHGWGTGLSVCRTDLELAYVVVESRTRSMDISDKNGMTHYALKLYFITEISVMK